ncbi:helix-turn-helix domain-containing protein [Saccharopolyspora sp. ASAGF58]|uniref:RNA-guided endonuclease InsQ/TnpB family protein n=1 Tax=Saccharopolyspora sp. ASAGF58 TaxID=2719023 RepID=UPI001FF0BA3C|nr:helix-turn-helix domain-containing protein [Saccharopolyspora sp. ASAGF58]
MLTGRRYRLKLTTAQAAQCEEFGNICRAVWNTALEQRREYRRRGAWMNYNEQAGQLADAKTEHDWLQTVPSHILQQALKDLDRACRDHGTFRVKWRGKQRWNPSLRFPMGKLIEVERLNKRWGRAKLPKLGWVQFRMTRQLGGAVRSATVSRDGRDWFVSFLVDDGAITPERHAAPHSGVGVGRRLATTTRLRALGSCCAPRGHVGPETLGRRCRRSRGAASGFSRPAPRSGRPARGRPFPRAVLTPRHWCGWRWKDPWGRESVGHLLVAVNETEGVQLFDPMDGRAQPLIETAPFEFRVMRFGS